MQIGTRDIRPEKQCVIGRMLHAFSFQAWWCQKFPALRTSNRIFKLFPSSTLIVIRYNVAGKHARNRPSVYLIAVSERLKLAISSGLLIAQHFHVLRLLRRLRRDVVPIPAIPGSSSGQRFNNAFGSGLINSWFMVGINRVADLWTTPYGKVLIGKLVVFLGMLALAASNRYFLTPRLGQAMKTDSSRSDALSALRRSILLETLAALVVLGLVAWLGTLAPPIAL